MTTKKNGRPRDVYVSSMGAVWKFRKQDWRVFLLCAAKGVDLGLDEAGAKQVCVIDEDLSDFSQENAKILLELLDAQK